jgi:AraC-like DNA-binding protein
MRPIDLASPTVFSTAGLPGGRLVELWEEHNARALIGLAVHAAAPLTATERNVQLAAVHLARVCGTAHVVERPAEVIRRDPADAVAVYLSLRGDSWFRQDGRTRALHAGDVIACDADRPFARGFARGLEEVVVKVPRRALADRAGRSVGAGPGGASFASTRPGAGPDAGAWYARALARMAGAATSATRPVPADEDLVLDLVTVLIAGRHAAQAASHRAAAKSFIEDRLTDPALGAAAIASATGISERQLSRVFAADGTSVPRHILARRLHLARALLADPAGDDRDAVAVVAARCGFTSAAYFSHAFAGYFGRRAGDVRRAASQS